MRITYLMLILIINCFVIAHAGDSDPDRANYRMSTGDRNAAFAWELYHGEKLKLTTRDERETFHTILSADLQTLEWEIHRPSEGTSAKAWRNGSTLEIRGKLEGKPLERIFNVGNAPWLQSLSVSLAHHLPKASGPREFWFIRPDTLEPHLLKVADVQAEHLALAGEAVSAWRVEIRPAGLFAALWRGDYWFRQSDRRFLKYRGAGGPPGTPMTEIDLLEEGIGRVQTEVIAPR